MYVKIENGNIVKYPYSITELKTDNKNVSFPISITNDVLEEYGVFYVQPTNYIDDYTKTYIEGTPELSGSIYVQVWNITDSSEEEINTRIDEKWGEVRETRNLLLQQSDWTQFQDSPITGSKLTEWQTYRQHLREITSQSNPFNLSWPTRPE
jgi:hypothetical protein